MGAQHRHKAKQRLFAQQRGHCHFCGEKLALSAASRFNLSGRLSNEPSSYVLACRPCCQKWSDARYQALPVDEQRRRSGRWPTEFYSVND
jgi:hypothetical protein